MRLSVSTVLTAPVERVWSLLETPDLLAHVARPLVTFEPLDPPALPERWVDGPYRVRMRVFGVVPIEHTIVISRDDAARSIRDNGHGRLVPTWDHLITIAPLEGAATRYTDRLEVRAGALTPFVWAFAWLFYRHRQRRWRRLVEDRG